MTNLRYAAATLALTVCGALALASCNKEKQGTEVPDDAAARDAGAAESEPGTDEPDATTGEVDHEAMTHGDAAEGDAPADG